MKTKFAVGYWLSAALVTLTCLGFMVSEGVFLDILDEYDLEWGQRLQWRNTFQHIVGLSALLFFSLTAYITYKLATNNKLSGKQILVLVGVGISAYLAVASICSVVCYINPESIFGIRPMMLVPMAMGIAVSFISLLIYYLRKKSGKIHILVEAVALSVYLGIIRGYFTIFADSVVECIVYSLLTWYYLSLYKADGKELIKIVGLIILGRYMLEIPARIIDFDVTAFSLFASLIVGVAVIFTTLSYKFKRIWIAVIGLVTLLYGNFVFHHEWVEYVRKGTIPESTQLNFSLIFLLMLSLIFIEEWYRSKLKEKEMLAAIVAFTSQVELMNRKISDAEEEKGLQKKSISELNGRISNYQDFTQTVLLRYFFMDASASLDSMSYRLLLDAYTNSSISRKRFVRKLNNLEINLSLREQLLCILFLENDMDSNEISYLIGAASDNAFKSAKSRLKQKLIAANCQDKEIKNLLAKFETGDK